MFQPKFTKVKVIVSRRIKIRKKVRQFVATLHPSSPGDRQKDPRTCLVETLVDQEKRGSEKKEREDFCTVYPTNNALSISFRQIVNKHRLSIQIGAKRVWNVYTLQLSYNFAHHSWWLGNRIPPPRLPFLQLLLANCLDTSFPDWCKEEEGKGILERTMMTYPFFAKKNPPSFLLPNCLSYFFQKHNFCLFIFLFPVERVY